MRLCLSLGYLSSNSVFIQIIPNDTFAALGRNHALDDDSHPMLRVHCLCNSPIENVDLVRRLLK